MTLSRSIYIADDGQVLFPVTFTFLDRKHVSAKVNGIPMPFSWASDGVISLVASTTHGDRVVIERITPIDTPLVDFEHGSVLSEGDLDTSVLQSLYATQEMAEKVADSIVLDMSGHYDAQARRLTNLAEPVGGSDAATKGYVDATIGESASPIIDARNRAEAARDAAISARDAAAQSAAYAVTAAGSVGGVVAQAEAARDAAQGYAGIANNYAQLSMITDYGGLDGPATVLDYGFIVLGG